MAQTTGPMNLEGVVAAKYDGVDIFGIFIGTVFVWPDPWIDVWVDEGTTLWESVWHDLWSVVYSEMIPEEETPDGDQQLT